MKYVAKVAISRLNEAIGTAVFVYMDTAPSSTKNSGNKASPQVSVRISMDHKHGRGHAITKWEPRWNTALAYLSKQQPHNMEKNIIIPLCMRRKEDLLPLRKLTFAYYSTLTHELVHCLGMAHFPKLDIFKREIMYPGSGGTLLPFVLDHQAHEPVKENECKSTKCFCASC